MLKKMTQKILVAFASAKIIAEENKAKSELKKASKTKAKMDEQEAEASVKCPYCKEHYPSNEIYGLAYKPENLKLKERDFDRWVYLSFVECRQCKEMFGIEEYHNSLRRGSVRRSFYLKNKL